ncbi:MAG: ABC transporter permease [Treponema sp.]|nr:ABC transporter permease [Treponema sp.]
MNNKKNIFTSAKWIFDVSKRFSIVDKSGRSAVTSFLSTIGIGLGVMTLIVVISVMNGFQMSFINAIMEISSYHVRVSSVPVEKELELIDFCSSDKDILSISPFYESQALMVNSNGSEAVGIIRAVESDIYQKDIGFKKELQMVYGNFNLDEDNSIVLGYSLAKKLGANVGTKINLLAMAGGKDVALISQNREFTVTGIFECGYIDINESFCFINTNAAKKYFGQSANVVYGIKLQDYQDDAKIISNIKSNFPEVCVESWKSYNRTFFGALRIEKNMLMLFVFIIFIVVGINIYNGIRRLVFERKQEISILSALGGTKDEIRQIFVVRGFTTGLIGACIGVFLGLLICINMNHIFMFISNFLYYCEYIFTFFVNPENVYYVLQNSMYDVYAAIPPKIYFNEVFLIASFGVLTPLIAALSASNSILKMTVVEVLHDE